MFHKEMTLIRKKVILILEIGLLMGFFILFQFMQVLKTKKATVLCQIKKKLPNEIDFQHSIRINMERAKRKRYFEQELFENLVTFGCNPQWHELMETCQKIGSANDASNLTRAVEMFLASEKTNPSEYPVDYICKHGDLEMFKTFIKLAKFDLDDNQPMYVFITCFHEFYNYEFVFRKFYFFTFFTR